MSRLQNLTPIFINSIAISPACFRVHASSIAYNIGMFSDSALRMFLFLCYVVFAVCSVSLIYLILWQLSFVFYIYFAFVINACFYAVWYSSIYRCAWFDCNNRSTKFPSTVSVHRHTLSSKPNLHIIFMVKIMLWVNIVYIKYPAYYFILAVNFRLKNVYLSAWIWRVRT